LDPAVGSVAPVFISRWDAAVAGSVPDGLKDRLGLAVGLDGYHAYRELMDSDRWQRLANAGHACSGCSGPASTKDPEASDTLYVPRTRCPIYHHHHAGLDPGGILRAR